MKLATVSSLFLSISGASAIPANCRRNCEIVFFTLRDINNCIERRCGGAELQASSNESSCDSSCEKIFSSPNDIDQCKLEHCQNSKQAKKANLRGIESSPDKNDVDLGILEADVPTFVATTNSADESEGRYSYRCFEDCYRSYGLLTTEYFTCVVNRCYSEAEELSFLAKRDIDESDVACIKRCYETTGTYAEYYDCIEDSCGFKNSEKLSFLTTKDAADLDEGYDPRSFCQLYCLVYAPSTFDQCTSTRCQNVGLQGESRVSDTKTPVVPKLAASKMKLLKKFDVLADEPNTDEGSVSCEEICEIVHPDMPEAADKCKADCPN